MKTPKEICDNIVKQYADFSLQQDTALNEMVDAWAKSCKRDKKIVVSDYSDEDGFRVCVQGFGEVTQEDIAWISLDTKKLNTGYGAIVLTLVGDSNYTCGVDDIIDRHAKVEIISYIAKHLEG